MNKQTEALKRALKRAFQYGVDHWYQADHDSYEENKKSNRTVAEFRRFVEKTCEALAAQPAREWVDLTVIEQNELCREIGASRHQVRTIEAKLKEKNT